LLLSPLQTKISCKKGSSFALLAFWVSLRAKNGDPFLSRLLRLLKSSGLNRSDAPYVSKTLFGWSEGLIFDFIVSKVGGELNLGVDTSDFLWRDLFCCELL
jgi:hypothetical protein